MRNVIAALVAGLLIMVWQTASHTFLNLHAVQEKYTPKHAGILKVLQDSLVEEGQFFLPGMPPGTSMEEMEKLGAASAGKPWAVISYHHSMDMSMTGNILIGLACNILIAFLLVWLFSKMKSLSFGSIFISCLIVGLIAFFTYPHPMHLWYKVPGIQIELLDAVAAFGLAGIWLGWYLPRKKA